MSENHHALVTVEALARHLQEPGWAVVDCRYRLDDPDAGRRAYAGGHIPGAVYADLDRDLSGPPSADSGRHPLPDPDVLAEALGRWGIDRRTRVVAYDELAGPFAARLWWLLRWLGHERAAVLDGGFRAWTVAGLTVTARVPEPDPVHFAARPGSLPTLDSNALAGELARRNWRVLDARAPERYRGEHEPIDPVAGHIPGALNRPWTDNLAEDGRMRPGTRLARELGGLLGSTPAERVVSTCGSGVTACHNLLALEVAGFPGAVLHPGSWSEWIRDPARPVERGA